MVLHFLAVTTAAREGGKCAGMIYMGYIYLLISPRAVPTRHTLPFAAARVAPRATRSFTAKTSCKDGREQERDVVNDEA